MANDANFAAGLDRVVSQLAAGNRNMSQLIAAIQNLSPSSIGTFTLTATATYTVLNGNVTASSVIPLVPMNASAATLQGSSKSLYVSTLSTATSFTVATASAGNAAGTEVFAYAVLNPH